MVASSVLLASCTRQMLDGLLTHDRCGIDCAMETRRHRGPAGRFSSSAWLLNTLWARRVATCNASVSEARSEYGGWRTRSAKMRAERLHEGV